MQTRATNRMLVVEDCALVFEEHVDYSRVAVPAGEFERNPLLPPLLIRINMLLNN